jgi:hypothetical protein
MSTDRASFVARITEGLEQRKLAEKCNYAGNPYAEYVRECKTRKRRNLKRKFYR